MGRNRHAWAFQKWGAALAVSSPPILGSSISICDCGSCCIYPMSFWPCNPSGSLSSKRSGRLELLLASDANLLWRLAHHRWFWQGSLAGLFLYTTVAQYNICTAWWTPAFIKMARWGWADAIAHLAASPLAAPLPHHQLLMFSWRSLQPCACCCAQRKSSSAVMDFPHYVFVFQGSLFLVHCWCWVSFFNSLRMLTRHFSPRD